MTISENRSGYTLLEILLAIGLIAILLGVTVPLIMGSFGTSESDEATSAFEKTAQAARASALESGETRRVLITPTGLVSSVESIPSAKLPGGWKLLVRRWTDAKFRKPDKEEFWEFNSAGICEPLSFQFGDKLESSTVTFDPLTAQTVPDE